MAVKSGPRSGRRLPPLIFAPILVLLLAVAFSRLRPSARSSPTSPKLPNTDLSRAQPDQPLNSTAIERDRRTLNAVDARTAYDLAKASVLGRIPSTERASADFTDWPPAPSKSIRTQERTEIDRLTPSRWRVRGVVAWRRAKSGADRIEEKFETDLQHGPTDDRWRLIDTEWLDASWMPGGKEDDRDKRERRKD